VLLLIEAKKSLAMNDLQLRNDASVINPRGVFRFERKIVIPQISEKNGKRELKWLMSLDGVNFTETDHTMRVNLPDGFEDDLTYCGEFTSARWGNKWIMTYTRREGERKVLVWATSADLQNWEAHGETSVVDEKAIAVADMRDEPVWLVFGEQVMRVALIDMAGALRVIRKKVAKPRRRYFDSSDLMPLLATNTEQGIFVLYDCSYQESAGGIKLQLGGLLLDSKNPKKITWRSEVPLFSQEYESATEVEPLGAVTQGDSLMVYWKIVGGGLLSVRLPNPVFQRTAERPRVLELLARHEENPILAPDPGKSWEAAGTFNPAALMVDGVVHFIYRAQGADGISTFGYAASEDGCKIDLRSKEPVYVPRAKFEGVRGKPTPYLGDWQSGWGWGGCEDPKLTRMGDRVYMTYVAHDGASPPRSVLTSIALEDFVNNNWEWEDPKLISPPGVVTKSACLLEEQVNGKYVMFHRIFPNILVDYLDNLEFGKGKWLEGHASISVRLDRWDSRKLSIGAPPIKTDAGWLSIYHAVDDRDDRKYKIGAMILDLMDPARVLWRSRYPFLSPEMWYENDWKPGIAYPSGAVVKDDELLVYYGGGDKTICLARSPLETFMSRLMQPMHAV
jgi:beta-1,2-mannobiose phosphorylase / 1,2-beta-oligomannan phosphorylase